MSNRTEIPQMMNATFRVAGKRPELWHAETGQIEPAAFHIENGRTTVPLELEGNGSVFVVFRQSTSEAAGTVATRQETKLTTLDGSWDVRFGPNLGAPEKITLDRLGSWTDNSNRWREVLLGNCRLRKELRRSGGLADEWTAPDA